jgi:hypothetical protein
MHAGQAGDHFATRAIRNFLEKVNIMKSFVFFSLLAGSVLAQTPLTCPETHYECAPGLCCPR